MLLPQPADIAADTSRACFNAAMIGLDKWRRCHGFGLGIVEITYDIVM
jgi:hypothetical protein